MKTANTPTTTQASAEIPAGHRTALARQPRQFAPRSPLWAPFTALSAILASIAAAQDWSDNRHAPDVLLQYASIKHHGIPMGYHVTDGFDDPSTGGHTQGILRGTGPDGTPYLYVSHSHRGGFINVVRMGSRQDGIPGERWRSNRLQKGRHTAATQPPAEDRVVRNIRFDDGTNFLDSGAPLPFDHPGGMQMIDNVIVVACQGRTGGTGGPAALVFIDVANPMSPKHLLTENMVAYSKSGTTMVVQGCGAVAITKDTDGRYLVAAIIDEDGDQEDVLIVWKTSTTDLRDLSRDRDNDGRMDGALEFVDWWHNSELADFGDSPGNWEGGALARSFQSLSFVRQTPAPGEAHGRLFLFCGRSTDGSPILGSEQMYVFEATFDQAGHEELKLDYLGKKEFKRSHSNAGTYANFGAGSGVYVSPTGQLIIYSSVHDNVGSVVKFAEYHHYRLNATGSGSPCNAWVELYEHDNGWLDEGSRSISIDGQDRAFENLEDLSDFDGFGDKASSLLWNLPAGSFVRLYEHDHFGGRYLQLNGAGATRQIADLHQQNWTSGSGTVGDNVSSVKFFGACAETIHIGRLPGISNPVRLATDAITRSRCANVLVVPGTYPGTGIYDKAVIIQPLRRSGAVLLGGN